MRAFFALVIAISFFAADFAEAKVDTKTTAVIIVDMQQGFYDRGDVSETAGLLNLVNKQIELLNWASAENVPVLFFEYDGFGPTDPRLVTAMTGRKVKHVTKFNDNGFVSPSKQLAVRFLKKHKIKSVIMAGINGAYCVHDTTTGAIASGFDVVTASDIVGNLNQNPPIYPNNTWYFKNNKLEIMPNLDAILY